MSRESFTSTPDLTGVERPVFERDPLGDTCTRCHAEPTLGEHPMCPACEITTRPSRILPLLEATLPLLLSGTSSLHDALWVVGQHAPALRDEAEVHLMTVHGGLPGMTGTAAVSVVSAAIREAR